MTHSLFRKGTEENLDNDYTILAITQKGINDVGSVEKKRRFLEIALRNNVVNSGGVGVGNLICNTKKKLLEGISDKNAVQVCFFNKEDVINVLKETIKEDLGISIVVQGLENNLTDILKKVGLQFHTVNHSLGIWGKTCLLPNEEILEITTMCGHAMVSANLVEQCIKDIKNGKTISKQLLN